MHGLHASLLLTALGVVLGIIFAYVPKLEKYSFEVFATSSLLMTALVIIHTAIWALTWGPFK